MSEEQLSAEEITELLDTITTAASGLQPNQQALLKAIIKMFKEVENAEIPLPEPTSRLSSDDDFLPDRAKVVMDYANPASDSEGPNPLYSQVAKYITRSPHS